MVNDARDALSTGASASAQPQSIRTTPAHGAAFTVLLPLDGSQLAAEAIPAAADICARIPDAELACMRALPLTPLPDGLMTVPTYMPNEVYQQMWDDQERVVDEYLREVVAEASKQGARSHAYMERGDPASAILDAATTLKASLIVMTTHGRTGLARFAMGSVADRVVRGGAAPVLLLRSFHDPGWTSASLQRALVPLDGSTLAETPLAGIIPQLAGALIQQVTLLRVVDPRDGAEAVAWAESYLGQARQRLLAWLGERVCDVQTLVRAGPVAATILDCAQSGACGVVVMATRGEAGIGRWAFGGVTDRVLRDGQMPLLLTHPPV